MRLHVLSDLHLEVAPFSPPAPPADVVVIPGDVDEGVAGLHWARRHFPDKRIVFVAGNHEFYGDEYHALRSRLAAVARELAIDLLDDSSTVIGGVRFVGATLWTDFDLYGAEGRERIYARGIGHLVEYQVMRIGDERFTPDHSMALHRESRAYLERALAAPHDGPTVVVTHHAPHPRSLHPRFAQHVGNPSFVSDLSPLMGPAALWIHGHTHASSDYVERGTRVVANPRGYAGAHPVSGRRHGTPEAPENADFDPALVIEV